MACRVIKKILGYELCVFDQEGTLFYSDPIVVIRRDKYTEIFNIQKKNHEIGDVIAKSIARKKVYDFITDNSNIFK